MDCEFAQTSQIPTLGLQHTIAMEVVDGHELFSSFVIGYTLLLEVQVKEILTIISFSLISSPHAPTWMVEPKDWLVFAVWEISRVSRCIRQGQDHIITKTSRLWLLMVYNPTSTPEKFFALMVYHILLLVIVVYNSSRVFGNVSRIFCRYLDCYPLGITHKAMVNLNKPIKTWANLHCFISYQQDYWVTPHNRVCL